MADLSAKQLRILTILGERANMVAAWSHGDLSRLERLRLVVSSATWSPNGRLSSSKIWTISVYGREFLDRESGNEVEGARLPEPMW